MELLIADTQGSYSISSTGLIRNTKTNRELRAWETRGYLYVRIKVNGIFKPISVARLAAQHFIPKVSGKTFVNHKDGVKTNNSIDNLEWVTASENVEHAYTTGLKAPSGTCFGIGNQIRAVSKLQPSEVVELRKVIASKLYSHRRIAKVYGLSNGMISMINTEKVWKNI